MKSNKSKQKSLRRQWSVDVPSSIQKKFREVTSRSKSLDEDVSRQKLLGDGNECSRQKNKRSYGSFENFGQDNSEQPRSLCSSGSIPWYSFNDNSEGSFGDSEAQNQTEINDIQVEVKSCGNFENNVLPTRTTEILSENSYGLLSTIEELVPRSPPKRTSPAAEFDINKDKSGINDVPTKFARSEDTSDEQLEPEIGERFRRYAICEEMERYIIVDHRGLSLRKYRETLIRHRVLKELCLL